MGSKFLLIIVSVAIVGVLGGAVYLIIKRNQTAVSNNQTETSSILQTQSPDMPSAGKITIAKETTIEASEYKFSPSEIHVKSGQTIKIILKNIGAMPHNWIVENMPGASVDTVSPGSSTSITLTPSQKGSFVTFCSIGTHRKLGMVGKLIVE